MVDSFLGIFSRQSMHTIFHRSTAETTSLETTRVAGLVFVGRAPVVIHSPHVS